jgi:hypothetical protein
MVKKRNILGAHYGLPIEHQNITLPIPEVVVLLNNYCAAIAAVPQPEELKRRAYGSRDVTYVMLRDFYGIIWNGTFWDTERICFKTLKAAKLEIQYQGGDVSLLNDKKLNAWANACESLLNRDIPPEQALGTIELFGLEKLRTQRYRFAQ